MQDACGYLHTVVRFDLLQMIFDVPVIDAQVDDGWEIFSEKLLSACHERQDVGWAGMVGGCLGPEDIACAWVGLGRPRASVCDCSEVRNAAISSHQHLDLSQAFRDSDPVAADVKVKTVLGSVG